MYKTKCSSCQNIQFIHVGDKVLFLTTIQSGITKGDSATNQLIDISNDIGLR